MMPHLIVLENLRSAYNTWNIIRTADALWWGVVLSGYTPSPDTLSSPSSSWDMLSWEWPGYGKNPVNHTNPEKHTNRINRVNKTALGAQHHIPLEQIWNPKETLRVLTERGYTCVAVEVTPTACSVEAFFGQHPSLVDVPLALIVGNEKTGVLQETLQTVAYTVMIPMRGYKESLNVWQAAAICMRELRSR